MKKFKRILLFCLAVVFTVLLTACSTKKEEKPKELKKVDFILDWTPNTNHTGLYVAKEKGYLKEAGIDLNILPASEESSSDIVISGKAKLGVYFQDSMANKVAKGAPIKAVAAIVEHNTSGIISLKNKNITSPKDLADKKYGTWNDPVELAMIKTIMKKENADFNKVKLIPNSDSNSVVSMQNNQFDVAWIYYGWDGILAKSSKIDTNFFYLKDFASELDYYSPVIVGNSDYLKNNKEEAKKVIQAIKKGYIYAMEHPEEAADILIKNAPELKEKRDFVVESQKYLSKNYASNKENWGKIDPMRWNNFYKWVNDNKVTDKPLEENAGFTNEFIE